MARVPHEGECKEQPRHHGPRVQLVAHVAGDGGGVDHELHEYHARGQDLQVPAVRAVAPLGPVERHSRSAREHDPRRCLEVYPRADEVGGQGRAEHLGVLDDLAGRRPGDERQEGQEAGVAGVDPEAPQPGRERHHEQAQHHGVGRRVDRVVAGVTGGLPPYRVQEVLVQGVGYRVVHGGPVQSHPEEDDEEHGD